MFMLSFAAATLHAQEKPVVFMKNSGWCWYQDPRAIIHDDKVIIGGVEGNGDGAAVIGVYDLKQKKILGRAVVNPKFDHDDHNSPVFYARPDGSLLTVYARHNRDKLHRYRISTSDDYLTWGQENQFKHNYKAADKITYMNLFYLSEEKVLYNFFRGIAFNPCFITSSDHGKTWGNPTHLIRKGNGKQRPYARYVSDGKNTIHISFTDAHPRKFGNSIYYAALRDGNFYRADGTLIKNLKKKGALRPREADKVFQGGGGKGRGKNLSAEKSAWIAAMELDAEGHPHMAYSYYLSNNDQRYRVASWNGNQWVEREVAYAGTCLYPREASYTGLITLDPVDPTRVVISTNVDPTTGKDSGKSWEIYQGAVTAKDNVKTTKWEPLTSGAPKGVRNIRPMVLHKDGYRVILWQRGRFDTYTDYKLDTVGFVEETAK